MIVDRPAAARGRAQSDWLDSRHTFSFGHYHDPQWMGFGPLRVLNDDTVAAGGGFPAHRHANMEIISVVLAGALAHRDDKSDDDNGGGGVLRPGDVQWMSAGHGIEHSEYNDSQLEPVHFLQIWIQPDRVNAAPAYAQQTFDAGARHRRWATFASPDGRDGGLPIRQQAWMRGTRLGADEAVAVTLDPARRYWLHVASGGIALDGRALGAGDALGYVDEARTLQLACCEVAEVLLFDLPA